MKVREPIYSAEVEEMLERREIDVDCWNCGCKTALTLHWVSTHRDMCCKDCGTLIILNTSRLQSEVLSLRRQLGSLHAQMSVMFTDVPRIARRIPDPQIKAQSKLALAQLQPGRLNGCTAVPASRRPR